MRRGRLRHETAIRVGGRARWFVMKPSPCRLTATGVELDQGLPHPHGDRGDFRGAPLPSSSLLPVSLPLRVHHVGVWGPVEPWARFPRGDGATCWERVSGLPLTAASGDRGFFLRRGFAVSMTCPRGPQALSKFIALTKRASYHPCAWHAPALRLLSRRRGVCSRACLCLLRITGFRARPCRTQPVVPGGPWPRRLH